jgi:hypothetical protein
VKFSEGDRSRHASYQTTIDIYRYLLLNQFKKGLHDLDLMLLSVDKSVERGTFSEYTDIKKLPNSLQARELALSGKGESNPRHSAWEAE